MTVEVCRGAHRLPARRLDAHDAQHPVSRRHAESGSRLGARHDYAGGGSRDVKGPKQRRGIDEATGREALRALARMGTSQAAAAVAAQLEHGVAWASAAAEEALWHFPPPQAAAQVRQLLARRDFVLHRPDVAGRLLDRAAQARTTGLASVAATLTM